MALFNKQFLKAVALVEKETAKNEFQAHATGFLVGFLVDQKSSSEGGSKAYRVFLVTNRHVFEGHDRLWVRFDRADGKGTTRFPIDLKIAGEVKWLAHENKDVDLAMLSINFDLLKATGIDCLFIHEEIVAYPDKFAEIGIDLGDEIYLVGFPMGISGSVQNYAIVRGGNIARVDEEIINSTKGFLVDGTVFPGNSGGPVFLKPEVVSVSNSKAVNSIYLLGVVSGYRLYKQPLYNMQSNPPSVAAIAVENSGLATVVPMNFAKEIYDDFLKKPKKLEKEAESKSVEEKVEVSQK